MKKFLSLALVAMMIAFVAVSCNKSESKSDPVTPVNPEVTDTITKNPIMDAFYLGKDMLGKTHAELISAITAKGYSDFGGGVYVYTGESYYVQVNDSVNNAGKIFNLSLTVTPFNDGEGTYKPMLTMSYAYDAVKKIGSSFNMGSVGVRYYGTYNQVMTRIASSYEEFVTYVNSGNFDKNNSIWLENSIPYYDATNWNGFTGLMLHSTKYTVDGSTVTEFSFPINFIDNSLKD